MLRNGLQVVTVTNQCVSVCVFFVCVWVWFACACVCVTESVSKWKVVLMVKVDWVKLQV